MHRTILIPALLSLLAISTAARADTFEYSLNTTQYFMSSGFDYDSPTLLTTATNFVPDDCGDAYLETCEGVYLDPTSGLFEIFFEPTNGVAFIYGEFNEPVLTPGTYTTNSPFEATLSIDDIPAAVTPEPASFVLLGTGILGLVGVARRRYLQA